MRKTSAAKRIARACAPRGVRNWLRSPAKSAAWVWNEARHAAGACEVIEMRPGWRVRAHPSAYPFAYFAQHHDPEQVAEFDAFVAACRPGMTLFDVGAHFGLFSLAALHYGGREARAVAVDPSPTAARMIRIQARLNGAADRLTVVEAAAGEQEDGWREMLAAGVHGAGYYLAPEDHGRGDLTRTRATTLDRLAAESGLVPTHVKVDVEGYEASVLRGGRRVLAREGDAPALFLELHNEIIRAQGGDPRESLDLLDEHGYSVAAVDGSPVSRAFILERPLIRVVARKGDARFRS